MAPGMRPATMEMMLMMMDARIAVQKKESIVRCTGVNVLSHAVRYSIAALITMVNRPSVRMVTGRDNSLTRGRTKALTTPKIRPMNRYARTMPAVSAPWVSPALAAADSVALVEISMPFSSQVATHRASPLIRTRMMNEPMDPWFHTRLLKSSVSAVDGQVGLKP